jgi:aryl sulfotransferase
LKKMAEQIRNIVWLASYPKSGNTWFRAFLTNLMFPAERPADINHLLGGPIASSRELFDSTTGLSSSDLSFDEIDRLRPSVFRYLNETSAGYSYYKIHDAYGFLGDNTPVFPAEIVKQVIYFIRNPLDVAVSLAHHIGCSVSAAAGFMNDDQYAFCNRPDKQHNQLRQVLNSWSGHVQSWVDHSGLPVLVVRYEDLSAEPVSFFSDIVRTLELNYSPAEIERAIAGSTFEEMKRQEMSAGFKEKNPQSEIFFRRGKAGAWKEELPEELVHLLISRHAVIMKRFGYL